MCYGKRLIYDTDAQHKLVALARQRGSNLIPLDMITYILFNDTPTVEAKEIRYGHWIEDYGDLRCSACSASFSDEIRFMNRNYKCEDLSYCPSCGVEMIQEN